MSDTSERPTGLWFDSKGAYFPIESKDKNDDPVMEPIMALAYRIKIIMREYPEISDWITDNPSSSVSDQKEWWKKLSAICIQHGWNLLWDGSLITASGDIEAAKSLLQGCKDVLLELCIPPEEEIVVLKLGDSEGKIVTWADLVGAGQSAPSGDSQSAPRPQLVIDNPIRQLRELRIMLEALLISQEEYDASRSEVISYILRDWIKQP